MTARNDVTGDSIITKITDDLYRNNYDTIFGKGKGKIEPVVMELVESHTDSLIGDVFKVSDQVENSRTLDTIYQHTLGEMDELSTELRLHDRGLPLGADGVVGEAIDCIVCLLDLIHKYDPSITESDLRKIASKKLDKWKQIYG